jgi:hypothetical protein
LAKAFLEMPVDVARLLRMSELASVDQQRNRVKAAFLRQGFLEKGGRKVKVYALWSACKIACRNIMRAKRIDASGHPRLEQGLGDTKRRTRADRHSHQFPVLREIVDLAAVAPPSGFISAVGRDRPF